MRLVLVWAQYGNLWLKDPPSAAEECHFLITGRSGDGKTTLLYRTAAQLVAHEAGAVLLHKDDKATLSADQIEDFPPDHPVFILIDTLTRLDENAIRGFFERLQRAS